MLVRCPVHTPVRTPMYGMPLSQSDQRIPSVFQSVYINGNYEYVNISTFAVLGKKLWLKEHGDLNRNDPLYSFKFFQSKAQN